MSTIVGLVSSSIFTALVTLLVLKMHIPRRESETSSVLANTAFWVYMGNWLKVLMAIVRVPVSYYAILSPELITLSFNIAGSMLVSLSTVSPAQLYIHLKSENGSFTHIRHISRLKHCMLIVTIYSLLFVATCLCVALDYITVQRVLLVWRLWYFLIVSVEIFLLFECLVHISHVVKLKGRVPHEERHARDKSNKIRKTSDQLRNLLLITLYMRVGICMTIVVKFFHVIDRDILAALHMFFVLTGLALLHIHKQTSKPSAPSPSLSSFSATTTTTTSPSISPSQSGASFNFAHVFRISSFHRLLERSRVPLRSSSFSTVMQRPPVPFRSTHSAGALVMSRALPPDTAVANQNRSCAIEHTKSFENDPRSLSPNTHQPNRAIRSSPVMHALNLVLACARVDEDDVATSSQRNQSSRDTDLE